MSINAFSRIAVILCAFLVASLPASGEEGSVNISGTVVSVGVGASYLELPNINYSLVTNSTGSNTLEKQTNHDGDFWGWRIDSAITAPIGQLGTYSLKAFFARFDEDQTNLCKASTGRRCAWANIVDDPGLDDKLPLASNTDAIFVTSREVNHWGLALESRFGPSGDGSLTDTPASGSLIPKFGLDYRRIDQETLISGVSLDDPTINMRYDEDLKTHYLGAYLGLDGTQPLGLGILLSFDAQAGVYWARADYDGQYATSFTNVGLNSTGSLSLSEDRAAFIASAKVDLTKNFEAFDISLTNRVEWYSWAPQMEYDDDDTSGGGFRPGFVTDTRIADGHAWSYTGGIRVSAPF